MEKNELLSRVKLEQRDKEVKPQSLYEVMQKVSDKRKRRGKRYSAGLLLTLILLAKMCGERTAKGVAKWVRLHEKEIREALPFYRPGVPCANTYQSMSDHCNPREVSELAGQFFAEQHQLREKAAQVERGAAESSATVTTTPSAQRGNEQKEQEAGKIPPPAPVAFPQEHWVIDGKSQRGSRRQRPQPKAAQYTLGLYNATRDYMIRQCEIPGKGHERRAALSLIETTPLHNRLLSADALHTHPDWCQRVLNQGGHYLLIAKANQPDLVDDISFLFSAKPSPLFPEASAQTVDKAHGRLEIRRLRISSLLNEYLSPTWPMVAQVFQITRIITRKGKTSTEISYGFTSLPALSASPSYVLHAIRTHWRIENRSHWRRDVSLGEDKCLAAHGKTPQLFAALNNTFLALADFLHFKNLPDKIREFQAHPPLALSFLLHPLSTFV